MKNAISSRLLLALLMMAVASCSSDTRSDRNSTPGGGSNASFAVQKQIAPPLAKVNVAYQTFPFTAEAGAVLDLPNGTRIQIPPAALVDGQGQAVSGEAELRYREFHDVADILMSGIPMTYDSAGQQYIFQTAGMMEIRAYQKGNPLSIAEGSAITVEMASYTESGEYNSYFFDEESGNWAFTGTNAPQPNPRRAQLQAELGARTPPAAPQKPRKRTENEVSFDFDVNYGAYPELKPFKELRWQYAGIEQEGCIDPNTDKWIFGQTWASAAIDPFDANRGLYYLNLANATRRAKMIVTPVVEGKDYDEALAVYQGLQQKYERAMAAFRVQQERLQAQTSMIRALEVRNFGIYNWDRIYKMAEQRIIAASYNFGKALEANDFVQIGTVYLVMREEKVIIPYDVNSPLMYCPTVSNQLVAFLPDNEIALFGPEDFASQQITPRYEFLMKPAGIKVDSPEALRQLLGV